MKSRSLLIIVLALVLIVVYYIVGTDYLHQNSQQQSLNDQITAVNQELALLPTPPADLEAKLAAARDSLTAARGAFAVDTDTTHIVNHILQVAADGGVKAIPLSTEPWINESVAGANYSVFRLAIEATGTYAQLADLFSRLETGEPGTLIFETVDVERAAGVSLLSADAVAALPVDARVKIAVYATPLPTG